METATPLMQQYFAIKAQYPDTLVLFQVGDFYELFFDDAKKGAAFLGIALTKRGKNNGDPIPLCGVPVHALNHYMHKLIKGGFKVAICDQLEEAKPGTVVKRGVTRVLTPGTLTDQLLLDDKSSSYLLSFFPLKDTYGLLFGELLTAQLFATTLPAGTSLQQLESELVRFFPSEIILPQSGQTKKFENDFKKMGYFVSSLNYESVKKDEQHELAQWITHQFKDDVQNLLTAQPALQAALFYFYAYIKRNYHAALATFKTLQLYCPQDFLLLDRMTVHNLELITNTHDGTRNNTLLSLLDCSLTGMGSRMIKKWIVRPLVKKEAIIQRQDVIERFIKEISLQQKITSILSCVGDLERIIGRILLDRAPVSDYTALTTALENMPLLKSLMAHHNDVLLIHIIYSHIEDFNDLILMLRASLNDDPHTNCIIKKGYDPALDRVRDLIENGHTTIANLEKEEQTKTGINNLKIRYNAIHGYYIEITKTGLSLVPQHYKRIQTLIGRERYITPYLQQLYYDIEQARTHVNHIEQTLFTAIKQDIKKYAVPLRRLSHALSHIDALIGLTQVAINNRYVRPLLNNKHRIEIVGGRHPVIETSYNSRFIPNDTLLNDDQYVWIITGPNMGGKSTYLRQVALNCIMAHIGSFVAAQEADIALLDRIFTRIGSGDNLVEGKSTFLVEMEETALICTHATQNSLVILDEVGRGTSTFDGLAIAQAVVEYLVQKIKARCLFATHYQEITLLSNEFSVIANYHATSTKNHDGIVFLYTIKEGIADGSFGIEVAKLAQLPSQVIARALYLVDRFTQTNTVQKDGNKDTTNSALPTVFSDSYLNKTNNDQLISALQAVDYDNLTPKNALDLIWDLKKLLQENNDSL